MWNFSFPPLNPHLTRLQRPENTPVSSSHVGRFAWSRPAVILLVLLVVSLSIGQAIAMAETPDHAPRKILFLGTKFQNDHESQEPTSDAERGRIRAIENIFKSQLESTGAFRFVPASTEIQSKISEGQSIGDCGGCEIDYGAKSGADISAWVVVQKVSNLILNINLYMVDVSERKILLAQSVDIRGNTDLSWTRGMTYLVKNHVVHLGVDDRK